MPALPDVNVLVALAYSAHIHHRAAVAWLEGVEGAGEVALCRITQLGFLRRLNNATVMGVDAQDGAGVWGVWDALLADHRFRFVDEPSGLEEALRQISSAFGRQPKRWQDAYLAAFAIAAELEVTTFDAGFRAFKGLSRRILGS